MLLWRHGGLIAGEFASTIQGLAGGRTQITATDLRSSGSSKTCPVDGPVRLRAATNLHAPYVFPCLGADSCKTSVVVRSGFREANSGSELSYAGTGTASAHGSRRSLHRAAD